MVSDPKKPRKVDLNKLRAARLEGKGPGPTVDFGRHTFQCPPEVPFMVVEAFSRLEVLQEKEDGNGSATALLDAVRGLLGEKQFKMYMAQNPSTEDMSDLIEGVFTEYGLTAGESSASPESS